VGGHDQHPRCPRPAGARWRPAQDVEQQAIIGRSERGGEHDDAWATGPDAGQELRRAAGLGHDADVGRLRERRAARGAGAFFPGGEEDGDWGHEFSRPATGRIRLFITRGGRP
jgi:hypothetical protein